MNTPILDISEKRNSFTRFLSPKGFKDTPIGTIPDNWDVLTCANLCVKIQDGTHFSPNLGGTEYLYVTSRNIGFGYLDVSDAEMISEEEHRKIYARCDTKKGDLLLTKDGVNTGNAALNILDEEVSLLSSVAFLRFDTSKHDPRFFLQYILSSQGQQRLKGLMSGNAITRLTLQKIRHFTMPVPPLPEQEAIAEALADVDALLAALDKLIAKKRAIKQAAMQRLLTGKTRLPGFGHHADLQRSNIGYIPSDWHVASIGELFSISAGGDLDAENSSYTQSSDYPYPIYANSISDKGLYGFSSFAQSKADSITVTARGTLGWAYHREFPFVAIGRLLVLEPKTRLSPRFYCEFINHNIQFASESTGVPQLTAPQISHYFVPLPSEPEQRAISTVLSDMDAEITALEKRRSKTQQIKQGMMQQLLTGRIRLVDPATAETGA